MSQNNDRVFITRHTLRVHLWVHVVAVGGAVAAVGELLRLQNSYAASVALIFLAVGLLGFPGWRVYAESMGVAAPAFPRWALTFFSIAVVIFVVTRLLYRD